MLPILCLLAAAAVCVATRSAPEGTRGGHEELLVKEIEITSKLVKLYQRRLSALHRAQEAAVGGVE